MPVYLLQRLIPVGIIRISVEPHRPSAFDKKLPRFPTVLVSCGNVRCGEEVLRRKRPRESESE